MVIRSQKSPTLMRRNIITEMRSLTKRRFNVTIVRSLATLLLTVGQKRKGNQKKQT